MSRRFGCLLAALCALCGAVAQQPDDEYYPYAAFEQERTPVLRTDSALFYRAVQEAGDLFAEQTDFNLPSVSFMRRGQPYRAEIASVGGVGLASRYLAALRLLGAEQTRYPGAACAPGVPGGIGGIRLFRFAERMPVASRRASVHLSGRNYLAGIRLSATQPLGRSWYGSASVDARTGRDMFVDGVFTDALTAGLRAGRLLERGGDVSLLVVLPPSVRGTRLSSTDEAFALTGDRLYNPVWGFQNGKVRNSRVRREFVPLAVVRLRLPLSGRTSFSATFGAAAGVCKYSGLGWYDARTPMPDNYRYLPGYTGDRAADAAWRSGDPRYTQIDWDELIVQNRMADGHAVYALEDRAERLCDMQFDAQFTTRLDERLVLHYGIFCRSSSTRSYKQLRDLLGARYVADVDQYLVDDDTYGNLLQNDMRHPGRLVREGDRFGYDYSLTLRQAELRLLAEYRADRLRADVLFSLGDAAVFRRGHYEKELFPGARSLGRSRRMRFMPYTIKATAGWAFSPRSYLRFSLAAGASVPEAEALFYQPLYNNRTVDDPVPGRFYAAEAGYTRTGAAVTLQLTAFVTATLDGIETRRYYDDLAAVYCDMAVTGLGRLAWGAEAAADVRLAYRWKLSLAASAGRYKYMRDPVVTVLSDVDNAAVDSRAVSRMGGCEAGNAPQLTACAGLGYFGPKGWGMRLSAGYAGRRYVEPMPLRRTARIARQGGTTQEAFDAFTRQERLGDAFTLDAALFKSFYFVRSRLTASLMLRNLLGDDDTVYSAYESLRVQRIRAGDALFFAPHATRRTYAYPRSFYLTISYRF